MPKTTSNSAFIIFLSGTCPLHLPSIYHFSRKKVPANIINFDYILHTEIVIYNPGICLYNAFQYPPPYRVHLHQTGVGQASRSCLYKELIQTAWMYRLMYTCSSYVTHCRRVSEWIFLFLQRLSQYLYSSTKRRRSVPDVHANIYISTGWSYPGMSLLTMVVFRARKNGSLSLSSVLIAESEGNVTLKQEMCTLTQFFHIYRTTSHLHIVWRLENSTLGHRQHFRDYMVGLL